VWIANEKGSLVSGSKLAPGRQPISHFDRIDCTHSQDADKRYYNSIGLTRREVPTLNVADVAPILHSSLRQYPADQVRYARTAAAEAVNRLTSVSLTTGVDLLP
jgi:hypothetical protein